MQYNCHHSNTHNFQWVFSIKIKIFSKQKLSQSLKVIRNTAKHLILSKVKAQFKNQQVFLTKINQIYKHNYQHKFHWQVNHLNNHNKMFHNKILLIIISLKFIQIIKALFLTQYSHENFQNKINLLSLKYNNLFNKYQPHNNSSLIKSRHHKIYNNSHNKISIKIKEDLW